MSNKQNLKRNIFLLRELPYVGQNFSLVRGLFDNSVLIVPFASKKNLETLSSIYNLGLLRDV